MKFFLDEQGLEHFTGKLKSKFVEIETNADARLDTLETAQAKGKDWNQNDETAADYIKNRTHYVGDGLVETTFLEETSIETLWDDGDGYVYSEYFPLLLVDGQTYKVYFDGSEYECVARYNDNWEGPLLGNASLLGEDGGNGEPFCFSSYDAPEELPDECYLNTPTAGTHTVKITVLAPDIHTLDEQFIPDTIARTLEVSKKMNMTDPVGVGSFSMNRKEGTDVGVYSHAEGKYTTASGPVSHAEGNYTTASGPVSHAEGDYTTASGHYSHAEGSYATASGPVSHAEGNYTTASGPVSHAEGERTTASGDISHAEGYYTTASAKSSHAEGFVTTAQSRSQHVQGEYNIIDTKGDAVSRGKYAHIVGNGNSEVARSNAHTIDWNGLGWFAGGLKVGGTGQDDTAAVNVALERIVVTEGTGAAFTATVPGIAALTAGASFIMIPHTVSTSTSPTLNVNGLGAKKMYRRLSSNATSVQVGYNAAWLAANKPIEVMYDGSFWIVMGQEKPSTADLSGTLAVEKGGTGATTAEDALANLLPAVTAADAGKTLRVSAEGKWVLSE